MTPKSITDNVKYSLGKKTLLIYVYDDIGKEIARKLFAIGYKKGQGDKCNGCLCDNCTKNCYKNKYKKNGLKFGCRKILCIDRRVQCNEKEI